MNQMNERDIPSGYRHLANDAVTGPAWATRNILVPIGMQATVKELVSAGLLDEHEKQAVTNRIAALTAAKARRDSGVPDGDLAKNELGDIRIWSEFDVADATVLASRVLKRSNPAITQLSLKLFIACTLFVAYTHKKPRLKDVLLWVIDPEWESTHQMLCWLHNFFIGAHAGGLPIETVPASPWVLDFYASVNEMPSGILDGYVKEFYFSWRHALNRHSFNRHWDTEHKYIGRGMVLDFATAKAAARGDAPPAPEEAPS